MTEANQPTCSEVYSDMEAEEEEELESFSDDEEIGEDTTAKQAMAGIDIQGIPWDRLRLSRKDYRLERLRNYKAHANKDITVAPLEASEPPVEKGNAFFEFVRNSRAVRSSIVHFQLRNLVSATSKHDVYLNHRNCIMHYSTITRKSTPVLDLSGSNTTAAPPGFSDVQVCTQCVKDGLLVVGGFHGDLVAKNLYSESSAVAYSGRVTSSDNGITNAVELHTSPSGSLRILASNNDSLVRMFDAETFKLSGQFTFPWAVNYATASPTCPDLMCVVGDDAEAVLADTNSGKQVARLTGHLHYSFAAAWHPSSCVLATGSQDMTTRLWDVRYLKTSFATLMGRIGAVRSLRFSGDGRFLAMAEPADFVHLFDVASGYCLSQEVDLFGEISGCCFSPDSEMLFTGVADVTYSSLLQFQQTRSCSQHDHFLC